MSKNKVDNPIVKVDYEEAKKLADLGAIVQDLSFVMKTCSRLERLLKEKSKDSLLIENMWTAVLIRYARCFADGKRFGLSESIFDNLNGEPHKAHKFYLDLRDKHIAHSVNPFEQVAVGLILSPQNIESKKIIKVVTMTMRHMITDIEGVHQLGCLAKVLLEEACNIAKQYEKEILKKAKSIPIDGLYNYPRLRMIAPGPESADKPRS
ncbi:MAG: hypothetical protein PHI88_00325 [Candidatus Pacebacteria bacterium]|nr:hypothetical protein [Candidatus Paceibacterota bacterium]